MNFKKFMVILTCLLVLVLLTVLLVPKESREGIVTFYYARSEFVYGAPDGVIGSEERQVGGHETDLYYLLGLYLEGPLSEGLKSPLPDRNHVRILDINQIGDALHIKLSDLSATMTDSEFTLACACLTRTCLGLHNVQAVRIESGSRIVRMNPANLKFYDESTSVVLPGREEIK